MRCPACQNLGPRPPGFDAALLLLTLLLVLFHG